MVNAMNENTSFQNGWDFMASLCEGDIAARAGDAYIEQVKEAIRKLEIDINNHPNKNLRVQQFQGFVFEDWAGDTFNIDAVAAGSEDSAYVQRSNELFSEDIKLDSGKRYSAKSYANGEQSAKAQARLNKINREAGYKGQERLVPTDQLQDAQKIAKREYLRNKEIRPEVAEAYKETGSKLTDKVANSEGIRSKEISRKELEQIAREGKKGEFSADNHGLTLDVVVKNEYLLKQAWKAGCTTAAVSVAIQLTPEIYKAFDYLVKNGELNVEQFKKMGEKGVEAAADGFIKGAISSALLIAAKTGMLGKAFINIDPTHLGCIVALTAQTVKNCVLVANGRMTSRQMGDALVDSMIIMGGYYLGIKIASSLLMQVPVLGYLLGTLIGTSFAATYSIGKKKFISFCVDSGFTCFGLVEQNYELPEEILADLGIETIPIPRIEVERVNVETINPFSNIPIVQYETVEMKVLRRGIIGVNKVGYVLA